MGYDAEGIDVSDRAVDHCQRRGLKAWRGDLADTNGDGPFDVITLWDVVEHLADPHAVLSGLASSLSDDGILIAKVPTFGHLSPRLSAKMPRVSGALLGAPGHVQYFTPQSLRRLVRRAGLHAEYLPRRNLRTQRSGGSLRRRLGRLAARLIKTASQDGNMLVIASRT